MRMQHWLDRKREIERLFDAYDRFPADQADLRRHWIQYLVVRIAGFLETSVSFIYNEYAADKASRRIRSFVSYRLEKPGNLRMDRVAKLVKEFGDDWYSELTEHADIDQIEAAVNSIVSNRNNVAHGEDISVGIVQLRSYFDWAVALLDFLIAQCDRETHTERMTPRRQRRH
jgi:hypothetical protein